jgi:hypothetical protein
VSRLHHPWQHPQLPVKTLEEIRRDWELDGGSWKHLPTQDPKDHSVFWIVVFLLAVFTLFAVTTMYGRREEQAKRKEIQEKIVRQQQEVYDQLKRQAQLMPQISNETKGVENGP